MEFSIKSGNPEKQHSDCVIVGVYEGARLSASAQAIDQAAAGYLTKILQQGDLDGKLGSTLLLQAVPGVDSKRVLLVGLGKESEFAAKQYRRAVGSAIKALSGGGAHAAVSYLSELSVKDQDVAWKLAQHVEAASAAAYRFDRMKSKQAGAKQAAAKKGVQQLAIVVAVADSKAAEQGLRRGLAVSAGVSLARDLGNLPPNVCTPGYLAEQAQELGRHYDLRVEVLERQQLEELGMGALLGVTRGSNEPPRLIVMRYEKGKKDQKPVVLVGKGITFDAGGISIKPSAAMDEMKYDMCGAASVLGAFRALVELELPVNAVGIIPTCENMPDGNAVKPGDILTGLSGRTIEVLNTDAEGRLILSDALTYAERFDPSTVVNVATLTGACVIALGHHLSGLFSNDDALAEELLAAGVRVQDLVWHMPLMEEYQDLLDSNFADVANVGGRPAGSITAACFLSRFTENYRWAHLDIAGTAWKSGKEKGATGRPVPLLVEFLSQRAAQ